MTVENLTALLISVPFIQAFIVLFLNRNARRQMNQFFSVCNLSIAGYTFYLFHSTKINSIIVGGWSDVLGISLGVNHLSSSLILLTAVIFGSCNFYQYTLDKNLSKKSSENKNSSFWAVIYILWASLNALFLSRDIFNIYITLELVTLSAVALIAFKKDAKAISASIRYLFLALVGSLFYLFGVALLYYKFGILNIDLISTTIDLGGQPDIITYYAFTLMIVGLCIKTAAFPFHFWLPPAHANASTIVSAILSAIVVKASFYLIYILIGTLFIDTISTPFKYFIGVIGSISIIWGGLMAIAQNELKKIAAYSTVSQLGYLFLFAPLLIGQSDIPYKVEAIVLLQIWSHALLKTAFFLALGNVILISGKKTLEAITSKRVRTHGKKSIMAIGIIGIGLIGLPPSAGFLVKWYLLSESMTYLLWPFIIPIILGSVLAAIYIFKILEKTITQDTIAEDTNNKTSDIHSLCQWIPLGLATLSILVGVFSSFMIQFGGLS